MKEPEMINRLKALIAPYTKNQEALSRLNRDTDFVRDLDINSANLIDIILDVEEAFNIEIDNEAMERMLTVGAAMDVVTRQTTGI